MSEPEYELSPAAVESLDPDTDPALRAALEAAPRGAFALAGLAVSLLLLAWLFVYFCVFLPRGRVS